MKKRICLAFVLWLFAVLTNAQDESVFNRLNGVSLHDNIYVRWAKTSDLPDGTFLYRIDKEDDWHVIDDDLVFKIRNNHRNNFKIFVEFYNPLNYSIKSAIKDLDDPAYQAINDFIAQLPIEAGNTQMISKTPAAFVISGGGKSTPITQSMLLYQWIYEFSQTLDTDYIAASAKNSNSFNELINIINEIKNVDDYLFNKFIGGIPEVGAEIEFTVGGWIKTRTDALYAAGNKFEAFKTELETSVKINGELVKRKDKAVAALKTIEELLSKNFDEKISQFIPVSHKEDFKKYSSATAIWLSLNYNDRFELHEKSIDKFGVLLEKLTSHIGKYTFEVCDSKGKNCNFYGQDYDIRLGWKSKKMESFEYNISKLDKDGTEIPKSSSKGNFTVGKKLFFYPFVSSGVLYTNFAYPNYSVAMDNGINRVARVSDTKVYVRPTVFLNLLMTSWDPVYPFVQLGITTGVNDALFPVGIGLSIGNSFSISGGLMLGYTKDLNALNVGDIVKDEATLKNDLSNKGLVKGYFSINYNIGKK